MFLKDKQSGVLVEVINLEALFDPNEKAISGRVQAGEEEQEPAPAIKENLIFPSGENLPVCWLDTNYGKN